MKKMLFLFNPRSGKEQIKSHLLRILDIFSKAGYDIHVHVTQCQLDARNDSGAPWKKCRCDRLQRWRRYFK